MSNSPSSGMTRRGFLKSAGALGILGAAGAAGMTSIDGWLVPAQADEGVSEYTANTFHCDHCGGMCALTCTVRDGRLVKLEPNKHAGTDRQRTMCLKATADIQRIYGDGRVKYPLKRIGDRGANEFIRVTWDEALDDIASKLKDIQGKYGNESVWVACASESLVFPNMLPNALRCSTTLALDDSNDAGYANGFDQGIGQSWAWSYATAEARDWVNSKLMINLGSNFCETSLSQARLWNEAREAGCKTITVDPNFCTTASKSDEWIPIEPGTDAALLLAMISVIIDENLLDERFAAQHSSLSFLVDKTTGSIIRDHEPNSAIEGDASGENNPFFVLDENGDVAPYNTIAAPRLSGSAIVDGVSACTAYDLLVESQKDYTPEWAAEITGIPAERIEELAREYAEGPSVLSFGWGGNDKMNNADIAGHAVVVLMALTGNIGKPGAGGGIYVGAIWNAYTATFGEWPIPDGYEYADNDMYVYDLRYKDNNAHALISFGDHFCQRIPNLKDTTDWIETLDLVVVAEPYFTEGCKWADYVLPVTSRYENDEEISNVATGYNQIVLQEKVIDPLFENKTDCWIQSQIAKRMGVDFLPESTVEFTRNKLASSEDPYINSLTIEKIKENGGVWPLEGIEEPRRNFTDLVFETPSGRMEPYYENMLDFGQQLPVWEANIEIGNPEMRKKYPLQLAQVRTRFRIHNQFSDSIWLQELCTPMLELNPVDFDARGFQAGDVAEVMNDRGTLKVPVRKNPSVRPGVARIYESITADHSVEGNLQSLTNNVTPERGYFQDLGPNKPFCDTLVEVVKA